MSCRYPGSSTRHPFAIESQAAAQACADRCGVPADQLKSVPDDHSAWDAIAYYLAHLCISITFIASPHCIVLSGGVMKRASLFEKIRTHFVAINNRYVDVTKIRDNLDKYIVPAAHGDDAGILGALELARRALTSAS
jgi:fructokinase